MDRHRSKVRALESRRQEILRAQRVLDQRAKMREESNVAFNGMRSKRRAAEAVKYQAEALEAKARNKALLTQVQDETQQLLSNLTPEGLPLVPSIVAEQLKAERDRYFQTLVVATESWRSESAARLALQQAQLSALSLQAEDAEKKANEAEALFHEEKAVALAAHAQRLEIMRNEHAARAASEAREAFKRDLAKQERDIAQTLEAAKINVSHGHSIHVSNDKGSSSSNIGTSKNTFDSDGQVTNSSVLAASLLHHSITDSGALAAPLPPPPSSSPRQLTSPVPSSHVPSQEDAPTTLPPTPLPGVPPSVPLPDVVDVSNSKAPAATSVGVPEWTKDVSDASLDLESSPVASALVETASSDAVQDNETAHTTPDDSYLVIQKNASASSPKEEMNPTVASLSGASKLEVPQSPPSSPADAAVKSKQIESSSSPSGKLNDADYADDSPKKSSPEPENLKLTSPATAAATPAAVAAVAAASPRAKLAAEVPLMLDDSECLDALLALLNTIDKNPDEAYSDVDTSGSLRHTTTADSSDHHDGEEVVRIARDAVGASLIAGAQTSPWLAAQAAARVVLELAPRLVPSDLWLGLENTTGATSLTASQVTAHHGDEFEPRASEDLVCSWNALCNHLLRLRKSDKSSNDSTSSTWAWAVRLFAKALVRAPGASEAKAIDLLKSIASCTNDAPPSSPVPAVPARQSPQLPESPEDSPSDSFLPVAASQPSATSGHMASGGADRILNAAADGDDYSDDDDDDDEDVTPWRNNNNKHSASAPSPTASLQQRFSPLGLGGGGRHGNGDSGAFGQTSPSLYKGRSPRGSSGLSPSNNWTAGVGSPNWGVLGLGRTRTGN